MKRTKVKIQILQTGTSPDGSVILISEAIAKKWKVPLHQSVQLRYGAGRAEVKVAPLAQAGALRLSDTLAARLGLIQGTQLCFQYKSATRTLQLGPLIGVMVSRVYTGSPDKLFGANTAFCRELTDACQAYGAAVFFCTPDDLSTQGETVKGWHYAGKWSKSSFPAPHVLYNRLTSRKLENRPNVQQFIQQVRSRHSTVLFNEKYLNKTEVFDALGKESGLRPYLPESHLLRSLQTLKSMCAKYPTVFLKPITGSLGKGIIRVQRAEKGGYVCHFTSLSGARKQTFSTLSQLFSAISGKAKAQRYQIQQGLPLLRVGNRPVDFRALVQRGETGQWSVTSVVARIAGQHHFVSNLARGGSLSTVREALARSGSAASGGSQKLRRAALALAKGVESQIPGHFAELGIDLAIDTNGRVWLIEINSKPSKEDNTPLQSGKMRPSVRQLVQYARFIAKF